MKSMFLESNDTTLGSALDLWLEWFGFGLTLSTTDQNRHGLGVDVTTVEGQESVNLTMVGVGVSQAYPVILQCLLSKPGDLLLFEQPELHLHPALQKKMGEFLLYFAQHDRQIIAETHSEHVINQIRASAAMDADNKIPIGTDVLRVELNSKYSKSSYDVVQRDNYLYNLAKNTDVFDQDFEDTKIVYLLEFNKIPEQARRYITIRSARVFHDRTLGANTIHKFSSEDEARSLAVLRQAEAATADHSIFDSYLANYTVNR